MPTQTDTPTVTLDALHAQYTRLAWLLKQAEEANESYREAEIEYNYGLDALIEQYRADHPELVRAAEMAKVRREQKKAEVEQSREALKGSLALYWIDYREDEKPLDGLGKRDSVKALIRPGQDALLHMQLREHAPWLLKVDDKALEQFVKDNAVVDADGRANLPSPLGNYLNALVPVMQREATISDKTLLKAAPDTDPDTITAGEEEALDAIAIADQEELHDQDILARLASVDSLPMPDTEELEHAVWGDIPF